MQLVAVRVLLMEISFFTLKTRQNVRRLQKLRSRKNLGTASLLSLGTPFVA
jgi:hypothetical protein